MRLPALPRSMRKGAMESLALKGVNYSDNYEDGALAESENLSTRRYPYIATRDARVKQAAYSGATAITAWEKLVAVQGTDLLYDGAVVGQVAAGEKQFAVVNTRMIIWPDKKYLDMQAMTVKDLGASADGRGAVFTANTMTVSGWGDLTELFKSGDTITISGCAETANNKNITIKNLTATVITVADNGFTAATETGALTVERKIPDLDFICESENRLWGCSNDSKSIYASALGDPTNFYTYDGLSTDSYALAVGSEGEFTGCCKLSGSVLFWKERTLHKLLGSYPAEYMMQDYNIEGLRAGCHKSMEIINEVLYYMGLHGVYAYSGGTPVLISANFGERDFSDAVGGTDGNLYYLSAKHGGKDYLLVYDARYRLWLREDGTRCVDFARIGRDVYFLTSGGDVYLSDGDLDDPEIAWTALFQPFYETMQGRKRYAKLLLRLELAKGSWMKAEVRFDGGRWKEAGKMVGKDNDAVSIRVPIARCDRFELRLTGKGPCAILGMSREYMIGSEK